MYLSQQVLKKKLSEYFSMYFYDLNLGSPGAGPSWTLGPSLNKRGKGPLGNAILPNVKHLSQVVLKKKIFEYFRCISMV